jgi:diguanylate cyclase (GGDEF)-like protein
LDHHRESEAELEAGLSTAGGRERVELLNRLSALVLDSDPGKASRLSREAMELSRALGFGPGEAEACFGIGETGRVAGDYRRALEYYASALDLFHVQGNTLQKGRCLRRLGDIHYFVTNLDLSLRYYLNALDVFENLSAEGDPVSRLQAGHLMSTIGNVLKESGDLDGALDYYGRSHDVYRGEGFAAGLAGVLYNIGDILQEKGRTEESADIYRRVLEDAGDRKDAYLQSLALNSLGSVCLCSGDFASADAFFTRSLNTSLGMGRRRGVLNSLIKLAELRRLQGRLAEALEIIERAEAISVELGDMGARARITREKASLLESRGDYAEAYRAFCGFQRIQEELLSEKRVRQIDILRLRYETEAKEREIDRLRRERKVQRRMIAAAALGLLLAGVSLTSVRRSVKLRTRVNRELSEKNDELAEAYSKVEELSLTDDLTCLANRRAMMDRLAAEQARSARSGRVFGLVLGDIDEFKSCNDRYGHACGDAVLGELAARMRKALREMDLAARWGGEEFLILLPDTDARGARRAAEKVQAVIGDRPFTWKDRKITLTMTFGVCEGGLIPLEEALHRADKAMYRGKSLGKNTVVAWES